MSAKTRVVILDDHQSIVDGYLYRLSRTPEVEVVGAVAYGEELEPYLAGHPADVVILDVNVPTGAENPAPYPVLHVIPKLLQSQPNLAVLVISMHLERALIRAVMDAGASGYMLKDDRAAVEQLASIIRSVAAGGIFLSDQAHHKLHQPLAADGGIALTPRQSEALSLCAAHPDATTAELARRMSVTHSTVRNLLSGAYLRLGVSSRAAAIDKARRLGLITPLQSSSAVR